MKKNPFRAGFVLLLCVFISNGLNAQNKLEVLKNDGTKQSFELSEVRKLTFPTGNSLAITSFDGSTATFSFAELRNLNFGNVKIIQDLDFNEEPAMNIFPNPIENNLIINGSEVILQINIFDLNGKKILQSEPASTEVSLEISHFARGIYMLQVVTDSQTLLKKIVKK